MIAVIGLAALATALTVMAAVILIGRPEPEGRHAAARPPLPARIKADATQALAVVTAAWMKLNGLLARDEFGDDDDDTVLWVDGHGAP